MSNRLQTIHDRLQLLAGEINRRKFAMEPSAHLKAEFAKLSRQYRYLKYGKGGDTFMAEEAKKPAKNDKDLLVKNLKKSALTILLVLRHNPDKYTADQKEALLKDLRKYL